MRQNRQVQDGTGSRSFNSACETKLVTFKVACWNVLTMQDSNNSDRPQSRSALVAEELAHLNIDIAAVSEERFAEQGSLIERGAGYTLHWSGRSK